MSNIFKLIGGIVSLIFGVWLIIYLLKHPIKSEEDINKHMIQGYVAAIGAIILGVVLIYNQLNI